MKIARPLGVVSLASLALMGATQARAQAAGGGDIERHSLRGYVDVGALHDTDALAETSAVSDDDDDLAFPAGVEVEDSAISGNLTLDYRAGFGDRGAYLRAWGQATGTFQEDASDLDRIALRTRVGPVFQMGSNATVGGGIMATATWRGGDHLYDDVGGFLEYVQDVAGWRAQARVSGFNRDDRRAEYDGWRYRVELDVDRQQDGSGPAFSLDLGRDDADDDTRAASIFALGGEYRWQIAETANAVYGLDVNAAYRNVNYDDPRLFSNGVFAAREDDRYRYGAGVDVTFNTNTRVRLEASGLEIESNDPARERSNTRVNVNVRRRF